MTAPRPNNPLQGLTLERILTELVTRFGWAVLGRWIDIRCFNHEPSLASSPKFLRRAPSVRWAGWPQATPEPEGRHRWGPT